MGDMVAGMTLVYGVMQALYVRETTGLGQAVDVSLFHTGLYQMSFDVSGALITGMDVADWRREPPEEAKLKAQMAVMEIMSFYVDQYTSPLTGAYMTKDTRSLLFVILQPDRYWEKFCKAVGREDLCRNPKYDTMEGRQEDIKELRQAFAEVFMQKNLDEWIPLLEGIPYAPSQSLLDAVNDVQAKEAGCIVTYDHPERGPIKQLANPVMMSKTPSSVRMPAPEFSQHTEEILLEYGYTWDDIGIFQDDGTIA
jgi:crotonobetainyl-CoA:carnitine CoA-transferase CaiB-like acyl-CoA transferase